MVAVHVLLDFGMGVHARTEDDSSVDVVTHFEGCQGYTRGWDIMSGYDKADGCDEVLTEVGLMLTSEVGASEKGCRDGSGDMYENEGDEECWVALMRIET